MNKEDIKMSIVERRYMVNGREGIKHCLTANQLYNKIMKDCKFDYNWIAPASELVRICRKESFPEEYANDIKIAILNCFAKLELITDDEVRCLDEDYEAVRFCYNSLNKEEEKIIKAKQNYLKAVIRSVAFNHYEIPIHHGKTYFQKCDDWINSKFYENINEEEIKFPSFIEYLKQDFQNMIKNAEKEGVFQEEDDAYYRNMVERSMKLIRYARRD